MSFPKFNAEQSLGPAWGRYSSFSYEVAASGSQQSIQASVQVGIQPQQCGEDCDCYGAMEVSNNPQNFALCADPNCQCFRDPTTNTESCVDGQTAQFYAAFRLGLQDCILNQPASAAACQTLLQGWPVPSNRVCRRLLPEQSKALTSTLSIPDTTQQQIPISVF